MKITITLPDDLVKKLREHTAAEDLKISTTIRKLLKEYFEKLEKNK